MSLESLFSAFLANPIVAFVLLISLVVFFHELGHFLVGKWFGIGVEEFGIGFGPVAYSFQKGDTTYKINWLPLGGYVRFYGADIEEVIPESEKHRALLLAPVHRRALVSFAGPFANFVLSFLVLFVIIFVGIPNQSTKISVIPQSPAQQAGLQSGDEIVSVQGHRVQSWPELTQKIAQAPIHSSLSLTVKRQENTLNLMVTPKWENSETLYGTKESQPKIGVTPVVSKAQLVPRQGDFFQTIGLKPGDEITHVAFDNQPAIAISYLHEVFQALEKGLHARSDDQLAKQILAKEKLPKNFSVAFLRNKKEEHIQINLFSPTLKNWALHVQKTHSNASWENTIPSAALTFDRFLSQKEAPSVVFSKESCALSSGDTVQSLNGNGPFTQFTQLAQALFQHQQSLPAEPKMPKSITVQFGVIDAQGLLQVRPCLLPVTLKKDAMDRERPTLIFPAVFLSQSVFFPPITLKAHSIPEALSWAWDTLLDQMKLISKGLKMLLSGSLPLSNLGGPLAVANIASEAAKAGALTFFLTLSLISVNIGLVNLLPLPALDGGHLLLHAMEALYGKPLPKSVQIMVQRAGIFLILILFVLVFYNDILRLLKP
jgi:regulator of sigma E protease